MRPSSKPRCDGLYCVFFKRQPMSTVKPDDLLKIVTATHPDVFSILGAHPTTIESGRAVAVRAFLPEAASVLVRDLGTDQLCELDRIHPAGFFEAVPPHRVELFPYRLRIRTGSGTREIADPYSFWTMLSDFDLHLFVEGSLLRSYDTFGAHTREVDGI